ncbi:MAG: FHA domain-containing protein [Marmoricola sp.]
MVDTGFGARVSVHDLGSTNGISVNGKKTDQATLTDGAVIRMGNTELVLHMTDGSTGV